MMEMRQAFSNKTPVLSPVDVFFSERRRGLDSSPAVIAFKATLHLLLIHSVAKYRALAAAR